jgi:hypothetical protein
MARRTTIAATIAATWTFRARLDGSLHRFEAYETELPSEY